MNKKEYNFYHDENEGYLLVDTIKGDVLIDIPISESQENTKKVRIDVKNYLKESNQSVVIQDCFDESRIQFENGEVVGGYSRYEGHDKEVLELWGFK
jgi:uncharacterized 2Fe-2S/4Fe-4S cluster protein (DUF4445 family)